MRKLTILRQLPTALLGALALLGPGPATAAVTNNITFPFATTVFVPCANNGAGEVVALSGNLHDTSIVTVSNGDMVIIKSRMQMQDVGGVGQTTGDKYRASGATQTGMQFEGINHFPFVFSFSNNFRVVGQGPGNNFTLHAIVHSTINANGALTSTMDRASTDCD